MTSLSYTKGSTTLFGLNYSYGSTGNNNGQITGITDTVDNGRSVTFMYDPMARLYSAQTTGSTNYPQWGVAVGLRPLRESAASDADGGTSSSADDCNRPNVKSNDRL